MTKVSPAFDDQAQMENILPVSADVSFPLNHFPKYKIGSNNQVLDEAHEDKMCPSLKDVVTWETVHLAEQQNRLSVRDIASKFDKNLSAVAKLSNEAKLREVASLEGFVILKKLRDALESLRGRMVGRKKDDVGKAISMVEALAVRLTQGEGELIQEKFEVKQLASFLKQASEDAKKLVNQERSFACAEIESARTVVHTFGLALEEEEKASQYYGKQEMVELLEEVQEARKIKMLHLPSKVMDMQHELRALRNQVQEKSIFSIKLQKELEMSKRAEENKSHIYQLDGSEALGSCLRIQPFSNMAPKLSKCSIQWYRVSSEGSKRELISGATKATYAPEPWDVGRILQAEICSDGQSVTVMTDGLIDPAAGLGNYVETIMRKSNTEFKVAISQMNGHDYPSRSVHVFHVGKTRMKLCRGWITKAKESYSSSMKLCGVRGSGNDVAKALYWQSRKGVSFVLGFESERERNAAIMLARRYALNCSVMLGGQDDEASSTTGQ